MDLQLADKIIIITGGASGIGEYICRTLAEEKACPVLVDRSADRAKTIQQELRSAGHLCHVITAELGAPGSCERIITDCQKAFGRIDGLVNNAGVNDGCGLENGSPEAFSRSIAINLQHYYELAHYAVPWLKVSRGTILNISSKTALTGQGGTSGYAASKGAQLALTREWAAELSPYGIRVNAIVPSEVDTPQYQRWIQKFKDPDLKLQEIAGRIPLGKRMTSPQEIASMAVFLLSERSAHTTGQWLVVDGGYIHLDRSLT